MPAKVYRFPDGMNLEEELATLVERWKRGKITAVVLGYVSEDSKDLHQPSKFWTFWEANDRIQLLGVVGLIRRLERRVHQYLDRMDAAPYMDNEPSDEGDEA